MELMPAVGEGGDRRSNKKHITKQNVCYIKMLKTLCKQCCVKGYKDCHGDSGFLFQMEGSGKSSLLTCQKSRKYLIVCIFPKIENAWISEEYISGTTRQSSIHFEHPVPIPF